MRSEHELNQADFDQKLARLEAEELTPRGRKLLVRDLPDGTTRFLIKESQDGRICEMIDCRKPSSPAGSRPTKIAAGSSLMSMPLMAWEGAD
jgi:hypothetical protein